MSQAKDRLPLPIWAAIFSTFCMIVGWNWDICWHRSVGRDTVWTPAHIAIYVSLGLAFVYNAWLVLAHTFAGRRFLPGVRVLGFSGPAGSFVTLWAILLQLLGLLFDAWWHDVYGLDSAVFSPPHYVLALSYAFFYFGQFMLVVAYHNTAGAAQARKLRWVELIIWSFLIGQQLLGMDATFGPAAAISGIFVVSCCVILPFSIVVIQTYQDWKWASIVCTALYMLGLIVLMQVFQWFPSSPRFGPVYHHFDFLLPPPFPLLLVVPAAVVAFVLLRREGRPPLVTHLLAGLGFVAAFTTANLFYVAFLNSDLAANSFFAGGYPGSAFEAGFRPVRVLDLSAASGVLLLVCAVAAGLSSWSGQMFGRWLRQVVR